jgi:hypothetical protein
MIVQQLLTAEFAIGVLVFLSELVGFFCKHPQSGLRSRRGSLTYT